MMYRNTGEQRKKSKPTTMQIELLQPWSTFVMKTRLPPEILEKMLKITDEIVENRAGKGDDVGAGQIKDQFEVDLGILEPEKAKIDQNNIAGFFLDICRNYVIHAFCQAHPFDKETILNEKWSTQLESMWINSQRDNEYFPMHQHRHCHLSSIMLLKIPEYLPSRKTYPEQAETDGGIEFSNNTSHGSSWPQPSIMVQPQVGDFFIFPAEQLHQVYPFRTPDGKGVRRSVSFNATFSLKETEQGTI